MHQRLSPNRELPWYRMVRAALTTEIVVDTATGIANAEGLDAITLTRVAKHLNASQPALYRHVDSYDDLIRLLGLRGREELFARLTEAAVGLAGNEAVKAMGALGVKRSRTFLACMRRRIDIPVLAMMSWRPPSTASSTFSVKRSFRTSCPRTTGCTPPAHCAAPSTGSPTSKPAMATRSNKTSMSHSSSSSICCALDSPSCRATLPDHRHLIINVRQRSARLSSRLLFAGCARRATQAVIASNA